MIGSINATFGVIIATGLYFIGLPSPLLWGIIAALMRFVPYIGSYVAAGVPILLAAAVDPGWSLTLWVAALFLLTEPIIGQLVEPMLYGRSTGLSPISVVISAIFWGWLWGPVGLILSTPLTLCLVVLGRHVQQLEFSECSFWRPAGSHQGRELLPAGARRRSRRGAGARGRIAQAQAFMPDRTSAKHFFAFSQECGPLSRIVHGAAQGAGDLWPAELRSCFSADRQRLLQYFGSFRTSARREIDMVAAWSVDRLGRSLTDLLSFLTDLHAKGVDLFLHLQGLDTPTPSGRAMFQMLGVFAEFERAMIRERVMTGLARARAEGKQVGRRTR
jgi:Resolvase, N terminal domain/AI-2E family transporter